MCFPCGRVVVGGGGRAVDNRVGGFRWAFRVELWGLAFLVLLGFRTALACGAGRFCGFTGFRVLWGVVFKVGILWVLGSLGRSGLSCSRAWEEKEHLCQCT